MTLAPLDLLVAVVAALAPHLGGLDTLGVDATGAGRLLAAGLRADLAAQGVEDLLPGAVLAPGLEVVPDRALGQEVVRQVVPRHPRPRLVEQGVEHHAHVHRPRPPAVLGRPDQRLAGLPPGVRQVRAIWLAHGLGPAVGSSVVTPSPTSFLWTAVLSV